MSRQTIIAALAARRAACPGFYRMPAAADGRLCRIKLPFGLVRPQQLAAAADLAEKYGNGNIELTTRGNLQLRGVRQGEEAALSAALAAAGLGPAVPQSDDIRNIMVNPVPGQSGAGAAAMRLAAELLALLQSEPRFQRLSPKFSFYLDGGEACFISNHCNDIWLSFLPPEFAPAEAAAGENCCLIGLASPLPANAANIAASCLGIVPQRQALAAIRAALAGFAAAAETDGLRRMREWPARAGMAAIRAAVSQNLPLRPAGAEAVAAWFASRRRQALALARTEASNAALSVPPIAADFAVKALSLGLRPMPGGNEYYLGAAPPLGRFSARSLRRFAAIAAAHLPPAALRANGWQSLIFSGLSLAAGQAAEQALRAAGFITAPQNAYAHLLCCAGAPHCARARANVQADAALLARGLAGAFAGLENAAGIIHLTACPKSCAASLPQAITLLALEPGFYAVYQAAPAAESGAESGSRFGRLLSPRLGLNEILPFLRQHLPPAPQADN